MNTFFKTAILALVMLFGTTSLMAQTDKANQQTARREQLAKAQAQYIAGQLGLDNATRDKYVNTFIDYYSRTGGNMDDMSRQLTRDYQNARDWYASGKTYSDFMACMIILEQNRVKTVIHP